jgi:hypothetical protein
MLAFCVAGCGGNSYLQLNSSGSPSTGVSTGGSVSVQVGALLVIGLLAGISYESDRGTATPEKRAPELDAARRVNEQDCTKPIEDWSANLKCR